MKKLQLLLAFVVVATSISAQDTVIINKDTTYYNSDETQVRIKVGPGIDINFGPDDGEDDHVNADLRFGMLDIGVSTYLYKGTDFTLPSELQFMEQRLIKSTNVNIALVRHRLPFAKKKMGFEYGLTISSNKYFFEDDFRMIEDEDTFFDAVVFTEEKFKKNRLMANYLTLPINLNFRSNPEDLSNSLNIGVGAFGGFLMGSNHKIKGGDISGKIKTKDNFNLNKLIAGVEGRIGYGPVNLYIQYAVTPMFQEDRGPDLHQLNFGISILPY